MKTKVFVLSLVLLLFLQISVFAADTKRIAVSFNQVNIKVDDVPFIGNNILYNDTTYVSVRDVASMLGLAVNYYDKNSTAYIGQIGAGEFSEDNHDIDSWDVVTPAAPSKAPIMEKKDAFINVTLNEITIKVHGSTLEADNILYNGTTYAPVRAVSTILETPINFDEASSTVFIGKTSFQFQKPKPETPKSGMYAVPAGGKMEGWQLLKGHAYESQANIYFTVKGTILSVKLEPLQTEDLNKIITWTDENGKTRKTKLGDLYVLFANFSNQYSDDFLLETFGDIYVNWMSPSTINADRIVEQYLNEIK